MAIIKPGMYLNGKHVDDMTKDEIAKIAFDAIGQLERIDEALNVLKTLGVDDRRDM